MYPEKIVKQKNDNKGKGRTWCIHCNKKKGKSYYQLARISISQQRKHAYICLIHACMHGEYMYVLVLLASSSKLPVHACMVLDGSIGSCCCYCKLAPLAPIRDRPSSIISQHGFPSGACSSSWYCVRPAGRRSIINQSVRRRRRYGTTPIAWSWSSFSFSYGIHACMHIHMQYIFIGSWIFFSKVCNFFLMY